jgi:Ca2+-binding EF-hand superfamily protein
MARLEQRGLTDSFGLLFHGFDHDGDGTIDADEFAAMFRFLQVPISEEERRVLFTNADADRDGRIDPIEALYAMRAL